VAIVFRKDYLGSIELEFPPEHLVLGSFSLMCPVDHNHKEKNPLYKLLVFHVLDLSEAQYDAIPTRVQTKSEECEDHKIKVNIKNLHLVYQTLSLQHVKDELEL
jgi:hypothetical protein